MTGIVRVLFSAVALLLVSSLLIAQPDFESAQITSQPVRGKVYMLQGLGGNIGVSVGEDGFLIVDDQFKPMADKIRAALKDLQAGELRFLLNTHWHGDHTGGNEVFGPEATIIAHTNVRRRLSSEQRLFGNVIPASPPQAWPVITFDESLSIHFNGEEIRVIHFPGGHTDGDSVIFFTGSQVVHMGDHFFRDRFPFVDLVAGGNAVRLMKNVAQIIDLLPEDVKIIPGHGPISTREDLQRYHGMLETTISTVRERMQQGMGLQEIQQQGLPETWESWGTGFISTDQWIAIVYGSLIG